MRRLLKVTAMTGLLTLLRMASGFVIAKIVALYIGPSGMAMLGQIQNLVGALNGIINAPAGSVMVRYTAENQAQGFDVCAPWWRASVQWILLFCGILIPLGLLAAEPLAARLLDNPDQAWIIRITVLLLPFAASGTLINSVINGQQQYRRYVRLGMLSLLISSSVMVCMIIYSNLEGALMAAAAQAGLIGLVMLLVSMHQPWFKLRYWWGETTNEQRKKIGGYILMAVTSAMTVPLSLMAVRNILITQVGWEAAGQWQAVWKISEAYLGVITIALGTYYLPRLSSLTGVTAIKKEINHTALFILPIVALMALAVYLLRDFAISLLFTEEFRAARNLFAIQLSGDVIKIASWLYSYPMVSRGATKWFIGSEILFTVSFTVLTWFFVSSYAAIGANIAYLVNYIFYFLFVYFFVSKFSR